MGNVLKKNKPMICRVLQSFLTTWALMKAFRMESGNIFTIICFLLVYLFFKKAEEIIEQSKAGMDIKRNPVPYILAFTFTMFYLLVEYKRYVELLSNKGFRAGVLLIVFLGYLFLFYKLLLFVFAYSCDKEKTLNFILREKGDESDKGESFFARHMAMCAFLLCMICWLPYFLYEFPGIMTPDSINQFEQVLGVIPYSNHHPFVHIMLFKLIYDVAYLITKDMVFAVACYTFLQMCLLAGSIAYLIDTLWKCGVKKWILMIITLCFALVPYHAVFSVTIWKDIPFAAAVLIFGCSILRWLQGIGKRVGNLILFYIAGVIICLFRSNGWYGFLVCIPFLLWFLKSEKKQYYPVLLGIVISAAVVKYPVMNSLQVEQPDFIESVCIPMQQITAVVCNDRELSDTQRNLIEKVVDLTYIKDLYNPGFADNIKELVRAGNQEYLVAHKSDYFKLWLELGLKYPGDYLNAYVAQTYGYFYPDFFYSVAEAEGVSATNLGVSGRPLIGGPLVIKTKEIAIKLGGMVPIYGTMWSMGVSTWILLICMGTVMIRKEYEKLVCYLPGFLLLLTVLIATPVAWEFRYVYFLIVSMPFYVMTAVLPEKTRNTKTQEV